ncbi:MAG: transporter substrate-binding domain-containing protein [Pseudorhodoplanes sp.]|nr:transporter substrate-binding domain-containing protein [Pseudorhodoplanes sp.]
MPAAAPAHATVRRGSAVVAVIAALACGAAAAQPSPAPAPADADQRELVVGTKEVPPFAMKLADGSWTGISIDLWRKAAEDRGLRYRFVEEPTVQGLLDGTVAGTFDVAVAALTVTAEREQKMEFTATYYATGLGIAIAAGGGVTWTPVVRALTSFGFFQSVMALIGLALIVGILVWLLERRHNEEFSGTIAKGLSSSVWWTTVAMTQRGIGNAGPRTLPGRMVAMLWMVGSIIAIAVFTAGITSALTVRSLQGSVQGVTDLTQVRVGAVSGTSTEVSLARIRAKFTGFPTARDGLLALREGRIDAFVYDRPLLAWTINHEFRSTVQLLDASFDPQHYGFALPLGSTLRKPLNLSILKATQSPWWDETLYRYLGM